MQTGYGFDIRKKQALDREKLKRKQAKALRKKKRQQMKAKKMAQEMQSMNMAGKNAVVPHVPGAAAGRAQGRQTRGSRVSFCAAACGLLQFCADFAYAVCEELWLYFTAPCRLCSWLCRCCPEPDGTRGGPCSCLGRIFRAWLRQLKKNVYEWLATTTSAVMWALLPFSEDAKVVIQVIILVVLAARAYCKKQRQKAEKYRNEAVSTVMDAADLDF